MLAEVSEKAFCRGVSGDFLRLFLRRRFIMMAGYKRRSGGPTIQARARVPPCRLVGQTNSRKNKITERPSSWGLSLCGLLNTKVGTKTFFTNVPRPLSASCECGVPWSLSIIGLGCSALPSPRSMLGYPTGQENKTIRPGCVAVLRRLNSPLQ